MTSTICTECNAWTFGGGLCRDCREDEEQAPTWEDYMRAVEARAAARERDRGER